MSETRNPTRTDEPRQTMADVNHVHPYDPGASTRFFSRGPSAMTDGGERSDGSRTSNDERSESFGSEYEEHEADDEREEHEADDEREEHEADDERDGDERRPRMKDVSHTPPTDDPEVNRVFERGGEGRADGE